MSLFFNDTATTEIYTLSLHDALPICDGVLGRGARHRLREHVGQQIGVGDELRSEEHTSELQSHHDLVCRLLLEKKNRAPKALAHGKFRPVLNLYLRAVAQSHQPMRVL